MRKVIVYVVLIVFLYCQCTPRQYTGYRRIGNPVVISEVVGEVIDLEERNRYDLFHGIDDFETATFYAIKGGGLVAEIQTRYQKLAAVNRDSQSYLILREYLDNYEWIQNSRELFERKWKIVDYDVLGFPITQNEISRFSSPAASCGCILGATALVTGIFWFSAFLALFSDDWLLDPNHEENEDRASTLFLIGIPAGIVAGGLAALLANMVNKERALEKIIDSRMPQIIE